MAEIAHSSRSIDLNQKKEDYRRAGVLEYLVLSVEDQRLFWFRLPPGELITANRKGIARSAVLPGLWLHEEALLAHDMNRTEAALRQGLASRAHASFVRRLERARLDRGRGGQG